MDPPLPTNTLTFDGSPDRYQDYRRDILTLAFGTFTGLKGGAVPNLVGAEECESIVGEVVTALLPPPETPQEMVLRGDRETIDPEVLERRWTRRMDLFTAQQKGFTTFSAAFYASFGPAVKHFLASRDDSYFFKDPQWILEQLDRQYGTLQLRDKVIILQALQRPFDPTTTHLHMFLEKFRNNLRQLTNKVSDDLALTFLLNATMPCSHLIPTLAAFQALPPASQTFEVLIQALNTAPLPTPATMEALGYANLATKPPPPRQLQQPRQAQQHRDVLYCWTHGVCGHKSSDCSRQAIGHRVDATYSKQLGGNPDVYQPRRRNRI